MDLTWTKTGREHTETPGQRARIMHAIDAADWIDYGEGLMLPVMPGLGIAHAISELAIPRVSRVFTSNALAPYGLYGVEANFKNGRVHIFIVDEGSELVPIASGIVADLDEQYTEAQDIDALAGVK